MVLIAVKVMVLVIMVYWCVPESTMKYRTLKNNRTRIMDGEKLSLQKIIAV